MDITEDLKLQQILIKNFIRNNKDKLNEIKNAIETGDIELAHRLTHNIKSNAGQFKKKDLQEAAEIVERLLITGQNLTTPEQIETLETEFNSVIAEMTLQVSEPLSSTNAPAGPLDAESALDLLDRLEQALRDHEYDCISLIDDLHLIPGSDKLIGQIENFDFRHALESLSELRGNYTI